MRSLFVARLESFHVCLLFLFRVLIIINIPPHLIHTQSEYLIIILLFLHEMLFLLFSNIFGSGCWSLSLLKIIRDLFLGRHHI